MAERREGRREQQLRMDEPHERIRSIEKRLSYSPRARGRDRPGSEGIMPEITQALLSLFFLI